MRGPQRRIDFQFLAMVAVGLTLVTREVLPVVLMTAVVAAVLVAYEAASRRYRHRIDFGGSASDDVPEPPDTDLTRWVAVMDRMLRSRD